MMKDGELDEMPEDEELLEDIREEFYRLYDPATGTVRDEDEVEEVDMAPVEYLDDISDENAVDDPFEWDDEEVAEWLREQVMFRDIKSLCLAE